jgi:hypothetical protein
MQNMIIQPAPLPPDPEGMNAKRAHHAWVAVVAFQNETGTDDEDCLCDLLCDLRHWADRNGYDWENQMRRAANHYTEETTPESE